MNTCRTGVASTLISLSPAVACQSSSKCCREPAQMRKLCQGLFSSRRPSHAFQPNAPLEPQTQAQSNQYKIGQPSLPNIPDGE